MRFPGVFAAAFLFTGALAALPAPSGGRELPFIADDYGRALAAARSRHVPIFVEAWAPW